MHINNFNHTIDGWLLALEKYSFSQLCVKPSPVSWSIGQVCMHLIADTQFYIEQIRRCIATNDYAAEEATPNGRIMLQNNAFPDELIEGNPANALMPQPESKEQLLADLVNIKTEMNTLAAKVLASACHGKAKHPGLGYFSAAEWVQFADMHFRHHLRQKKRIDDFLEAGAAG